MGNAPTSCIRADHLTSAEFLVEAEGTPVYLNVYHLNDQWVKSNTLSKQVFGIGGAFHAGIEVHGVEWTYGSEFGISQAQPRSHDVHIYHESILLGETYLSETEVQNLVLTMQKIWVANDYDMLEHNCANFSDALSWELVGEPIPRWVTRFPSIAAQAAAHLDNVIDVKKHLQQDIEAGDQTPTSAPPSPSPRHRRYTWP